MSLLNDPVFKTVAECTTKCLLATATRATQRDHAATLTMVFITAAALAEQHDTPLPAVLKAMGVPEAVLDLLQETTDSGIPLTEALTRFNAPEPA